MSVMVQRLSENGRTYVDYQRTISGDSFLWCLRNETFTNWGRAIDISGPMHFPEFFTVDVVFQSTKGKTRQRFLVPTVKAKP